MEPHPERHAPMVQLHVTDPPEYDSVQLGQVGHHLSGFVPCSTNPCCDMAMTRIRCQFRCSIHLYFIWA